MNSTLARPTAQFAVPPSQNTAPVLEFRCLYTYDLRRKQKRWQDGFCKFHTFNKRVMLYDTSRNFIGDTHWQEPEPLREGDETTLDRCGAILQVEDQIGSSQTDLTPLFERNRQKDKPADATVRPSFTERATSGGKRALQPRSSTGVLKHRSLNTLLGTPKGALGKATLPKSPYERRHANGENNREDSGGLKRRRTDATILEEDLSTSKRMKASESPVDTVSLAITRDAQRRIPSKNQKQVMSRGAATSNPQPSAVRQVIDITSDLEIDQSLASDVTIPSTPQKLPTATPLLLTRRSLSARSAKKLRAPASVVPDLPVSPPVSKTNQITNVEAELGGQDGFISLSDIDRQERKRKAKPLRPAKAQPRNMLVCQNLPPKQKPQKSDSRDVGPLRRATPENLQMRDSIVSERKLRGDDIQQRRKKPTQNQDIGRDTSSSPPAFSTLPPRERRICKSTEPILLSDDDSINMPAALPVLGMRRASPQPQDSHPPPRFSPPPSRPFRRVYSAGDASLSLSFPPSAFPTLPFLSEDSATEAINRSPPKPAKRNSPIKRSFSENDRAVRGDGAAAMSRKEEKTRPAAAEREEEGSNVVQETEKDPDVGPWSTEALDLFDWRPPDWEERMRRKGVPPVGAVAVC